MPLEEEEEKEEEARIAPDEDAQAQGREGKAVSNEKNNDPLAYVAVSEKACERRTGNIMTKLDEVNRNVMRISDNFGKHRAWHDGKEQAEKRQADREARATSKSGNYARWIGLFLVGLLAFGGAVWTVAHISKPNPVEIAKAMKELP